MKNKKYLIVEVAECKKCGGTGIAENWLYEELEKEIERMCEEGLKEKVFEFGIEEFERQWFREQGFSKPPEREITCYECYGTGEVRTEVEISEDIYMKALEATERRTA